MTAGFLHLRWLLVVGLATGCANPRRDMEKDRNEVQQTIQSRLGIEAPIAGRAEDDGAMFPEVQTLLEDGLNEEEAVKIAFLNNRGIRAELELLRIGRADLLQAGLLNNPVFSANAKFFRSGTEVELGIAQSFLDLFYRPLRKRVAEADLDAIKAAVARRAIGVVYELRRAFVALRASQQLVEMRQQVLKATKASFDLMTDLHKAGNVTDPQLTAEEASFSRAEIDLAAAEIAAYEAREPLNALLGLWGQDIAWRVEGRLEDDAGTDLALETLESKTVAASFALAENRARIDAAAQRAGLVSWEGWIGTGEIGPVAKRDAIDDKWGFGPGFSLSLPIFDQGQGRTAAAQALFRELLSRHVELAVEIRSAARTFRERLIALRSRVDYLRKVYLPLRARLVRETLQNYNAMQIGAFEVLLARQQEIDAGREYIETLRDAWLTRLDLEELLAGSMNATRLAPMKSASGHEGMTLERKGH